MVNKSFYSKLKHGAHGEGAPEPAVEETKNGKKLKAILWRGGDDAAIHRRVQVSAQLKVNLRLSTEQLLPKPLGLSSGEIFIHWYI